MPIYTTSQYPWTPGQAPLGAKVQNSPMAVVGLLQKQRGVYSFPPAITAPGTIVSAGTVPNSTGVDCLVYASATTGISAVKTVSYNGGNATTVTVPGSIYAGATGGPYFVAGPGAIILTYTGTLTWVWQPV